MRPAAGPWGKERHPSRPVDGEEAHPETTRRLAAIHSSLGTIRSQGADVTGPVLSLLHKTVVGFYPKAPLRSIRRTHPSAQAAERPRLPDPIRLLMVFQTYTLTRTGFWTISEYQRRSTAAREMAPFCPFDGTGLSISPTPHLRPADILHHALVAQWIERWIPNPGAAGSIPAGGTNQLFPKGPYQVPANRLVLSWFRWALRDVCADRRKPHHQYQSNRRVG